METVAKLALGEQERQGWPGTDYLVSKQNRNANPPGSTSALPSVLDGLLAAHRERHDDPGLSFPQRDAARDLHAFRNLVQHQYRVPSAIDVQRSRVHARDFFEAILSEIYGMDPCELSRRLLIANKHVRRHVSRAEKAALTTDFVEALDALGEAHYWLMDEFAKKSAYLDAPRTGAHDRAKEHIAWLQGVSHGVATFGPSADDDQLVIATMIDRRESRERYEDCR